jgi:argininosuccinate synthase
LVNIIYTRKEMSEKIILAYSGGLDTSVAIKWLQENYGMDVITLTVDVGNERDFSAIKEKALKAGAIKAIVTDLKKEFVKDYIFPALKAGALYQGCYPLSTALSRPLIAKALVAAAEEEGAQTIAHGCTGKGNDQVRIEVGISILAPELKIIAPARLWGMTRQQTFAYARKHSIPLPITPNNPYSIDENLWGRSIECGVLEDPNTEPPEDVYAWTTNPSATPDKATYLKIGFDKGVPVSLDGRKTDGLELIEKLNQTAGSYGIGRIDHIEDRLVGIKSREIYENPAAITLLTAHKALESLTLGRRQLRFKETVSAEYSDLLYDGLWFSSIRQDLSAFIDSTQRFVTGTVRLKLEKGNLRVVGRQAQNSLYHHGLATYDKGDQFNQDDAAGFIQLWGLSSRVQAQAQQDKGEK